MQVRRRLLEPFGVFLALTMLLFARTWVAPTTAWIGEPGDPPMFMWHLRWVPYALSHGLNPLVTDHLNVPDGVNLMWNTPMPLAGFLLAPITTTVGPVFSYNVLMTLAVALSGWCAYLMLTRYTASRPAAILGGVLYGFSPYMVAHALAHTNLATAFVPPLMVMLLDEILVRQRRSAVRTGAWLGVVAAAQLLLSEELLATEMTVAILALLVLVALHPGQALARKRVAHAAQALGAALVVSLLLSLGPLLVQFFGSQRVYPGTALWGPGFLVSDLLSFVVPTGGQALSPSWAKEIAKEFSSACCPAEQNSYLGVPLLLFASVVTARWWSKLIVRFAAVLSAVLVVLSMGPNLHVGGSMSAFAMPFRVIADLPVFGNIIAVRLMLYVYLLVAILLAVWVDEVMRVAPRLHRAAAIIVVVAVLAPLTPQLRFPSTPARIPKFFQSEAVHRIPVGSVALVAPLPRDTSTSEPMLWQAATGMRFRMVGGYATGPDQNGRFSFLPIPTELSILMEEIQRGATPALDESMKQRLRAELRAKAVDVVLVGPMPNQESMVELFRSLLRRDAVEVGGVHLWPVNSQEPEYGGR